jgi:hypothetical protein
LAIFIIDPMNGIRIILRFTIDRDDQE